MSNIIFHLLFTLVFAGTLPLLALGSESLSPWENKLPFEQGTITYTISGSESGSQIVYVKDYGQTIARYRTTSIKMFGFSQSQETLEIITPEFIYNIDLTEKTGTKTVNPQKFFLVEYNKLSSSDKKKISENTEKMGVPIMGGSQVTVEPNSSKILGFDCDVVTMSGGKTYTFHGTSVDLKTDISTMGAKIQSEATKVAKGSVPSDKFSPPTGIAITYDKNSEDMLKKRAREMITNLLEGKPMTDFSAGQQKELYNRPPPQAPKVGNEPPENHPPEKEMEQGLQDMMKGLQGLFGK